MNARYPVLESCGYIVSILSTFLLGLVAWEGAKDGETRLLILAGAALAVTGMGLRWYVWWRRHGRGRKG